MHRAKRHQTKRHHAKRYQAKSHLCKNYMESGTYSCYSFLLLPSISMGQNRVLSRFLNPFLNLKRDILTQTLWQKLQRAQVDRMGQNYLRNKYFASNTQIFKIAKFDNHKQKPKFSKQLIWDSFEDINCSFDCCFEI